MGYYDGDTVTYALKLRPVFLHERELLRHKLRPIDSLRDQPGFGETNGVVQSVNAGGRVAVNDVRGR